MNPIAMLLALAVAHAADTTSTELVIEGMVTASCPVLVEAAVGRIAGVVEVDADLDTKHVEVTYDPTETTPAEIQRVIKDQVGFDSKVTPPKER